MKNTYDIPVKRVTCTNIYCGISRKASSIVLKAKPQMVKVTLMMKVKGREQEIYKSVEIISKPKKEI